MLRVSSNKRGTETHGTIENVIDARNAMAKPEYGLLWPNIDWRIPASDN